MKGVSPPQTLKQQQLHRLVRLASISDARLAEQLRPLGFYPGALVCVLRRAPAGDPIIVATPTHVVAISRQAAEQIHVQSITLPHED